jgi:hypothetical protein
VNLTRYELADLDGRRARFFLLNPSSQEERRKLTEFGSVVLFHPVARGQIRRNYEL